VKRVRSRGVREDFGSKVRKGSGFSFQSENVSFYLWSETPPV
jgi:hypothetical protein